MLQSDKLGNHHSLQFSCIVAMKQSPRFIKYESAEHRCLPSSLKAGLQLYGGCKLAWFLLPALTMPVRSVLAFTLHLAYCSVNSVFDGSRKQSWCCIEQLVFCVYCKSLLNFEEHWCHYNAKSSNISGVRTRQQHLKKTKFEINTWVCFNIILNDVLDCSVGLCMSRWQTTSTYFKKK